jgi:hypothetical protein
MCCGWINCYTSFKATISDDIVVTIRTEVTIVQRRFVWMIIVEICLHCKFCTMVIKTQSDMYVGS